MSFKNYRPLPPSIIVGSSEIHGSGLIAIDKIEADTFIGISHYVLPGKSGLVIRTPLGGFGNHSQGPNCEKILFRTEDEIKIYGVWTIDEVCIGDELTWHYSLYNPS